MGLVFNSEDPVPPESNKQHSGIEEKLYSLGVNGKLIQK